MQQGAVLFRVDRGVRFGQLGARITRLHHLAQQIAFGQFPVLLAKTLAHRQAPAGTQVVGVERFGGRRERLETAQHQVQVAHQRRFVRRDGDRHDRLCRIDIEFGIDHGGVIAFGGDQFLGLVGRGAHQAHQLAPVQARIALPAHQVQIVLQQLGQRGRGVDVDGIDQILGARDGSGQQGEHGHGNLCQNSSSA